MVKEVTFRTNSTPYSMV